MDSWVVFREDGIYLFLIDLFFYILAKCTQHKIHHLNHYKYAVQWQ